MNAHRLYGYYTIKAVDAVGFVDSLRRCLIIEATPQTVDKPSVWSLDLIKMDSLFLRKGGSIIEAYPLSGRKIRQHLAGHYVFRWPGIMAQVARYDDNLHIPSDPANYRSMREVYGLDKSLSE